MKLDRIRPQNLPEQLIWWMAIATYPLYFMGALYIVNPVIIMALTAYALYLWRQPKGQQQVWLGATAWAWLVAGVVIEIGLVMGHINFDLGWQQIVISSINNWGRKWAMIPMLIVVGHLAIRPQLIYRIACLIAGQSLIMALVGTVGAIVGIPKIEYVSPLAVFGGGANHYRVDLFQNAFAERLYLFTPWSTAIGTLGSFFFFLAWQEKNPIWRITGVVCSLIMVLLSQSRAALLCIPFVLILAWIIKNIFYPQTQLLLSFVFFLLGIFSFQITKGLTFAKNQFNSFRGKDSIYSSRIRNNLYRVTIKKWWSDAPIWGHGRIKGTGPAFLANMPVGSHNTWLGGLYTFGLVGFIPLAIACLLTLFNLVFQAKNSAVVNTGFCVLMSLFVATFTDSIEHIAYLYWPGFLFVGIALREIEIKANQPAINPIYTT